MNIVDRDAKRGYNTEFFASSATKTTGSRSSGGRLGSDSFERKTKVKKEEFKKTLDKRAS